MRSKGSRTPLRRRASSASASIAGWATCSGRSVAARTARARSSSSAIRRRRRWNERKPPPTSYASTRSMSTQKHLPRTTPLGFQPPAIGDEEIAAVVETLRSGWLTTGPRTAELERRMSVFLEAEHVIAVSSGTAALQLALLALDVGPGDEVITTPITWPATANVIVHAGATPVFADVRDADLNIDPGRVAALVTPKTKAIVPVHLAGQPADLDPLLAHGLPVLEDAAHAVESRYRGRKIGSISDATCFSLYATKNVAAGEGGLIATNRDDVAQRVEQLRLMRRGDGSLYDIAVPGYKANLSDVLASIALAQLDKVGRHAEIRARQFALYDEGLAGLDGITPLARDARDQPSLHMYVARNDAP